MLKMHGTIRNNLIIATHKFVYRNLSSGRLEEIRLVENLIAPLQKGFYGNSQTNITYLNFSAHNNNMVKKLTEEQKKEICMNYKKGISTIKLGKQYNVNFSTICRLLHKKNIDIRTPSEAKRIYSCNHSFFDIIDSEVKAYWLGFIDADGYINPKRKCLQIILSRKDKIQLQNFLGEINSNHPIKDIHYSYDVPKSMIYIRSPQLTKSISKHSSNFDLFNNNLKRHYIRGLFDGDGCICNSQNPYFSLIGEKKLIEAIQKYLIKEIGINKTKLYKRHLERDGNVISLVYVGRNNVKKIYNYLYQDSTIFLERKKWGFEQIEKNRPIQKIKVCSIINCNKKYRSKGLCKNHYYEKYLKEKRHERYVKLKK